MKKFPKINLKKLFLILLPPLIFVWPIFNNKPFPLSINLVFPDKNKVIPLTFSKLPEEIEIDSTSNSLASTNILAEIFKIEIYSMPVELCVNNKNSIIENSEIINRKGLDEQAGAVGVKFTNQYGEENTIYTKIGEKNCEHLPKGSKISSNVEIRNPLPVSVTADGNEIKLEQNNDLAVELNYKIASIHIKFILKNFIYNFLIVLIAWSALVQLYINTYKFIKK